MEKFKCLEINNIYKEYYWGVYSLINASIRNTETSEELTNDVFVKVDKYIHTYNPKIGMLSTWIFTITKNIIIDALRSAEIKKNKKHYSLDNSELQSSFVVNDNPHTVLVRKERSETLSKSIDRLPEKYRKVFDYIYNQDLKLREVSKELKLPLNTVKGYVHRCKAILKDSELKYA